MELRVPIDVVILRLLTDGNQVNPVRMHWLIEKEHNDDLREEFGIEEWGVDYVQQRMAHLARVDLVDRVPPKGSGLYRINDYGRAALEKYLSGEGSEFSFSEIVELADDVEVREVPKDDLPWIEGE